MLVLTRERVREILRDLTAGSGPGALVARGGGSAFAIRVAGAAIIFGNQILLARLLGAEAYGEYAYVVTWTGVLGILGLAGFGSSTVRYVALYRGRAEFGLLRGFLRRSTQFVLGSSMLLAAATLVVVFALGERLSPSLRWSFQIGVLLIPLVSLLQLVGGGLQGFRKVVSALVPVELARPALLTVGLAVLWISNASDIASGHALAVNVAGTTLCLAAAVLLLRSTVAAEATGGTPRRYETGAWTRTSLSMMLVGAFSLVMSQTDTLMIGVLRGTSEVGIYVVASRLAGFITFMLGAVRVMAAPLFAEYHAAGDRRRLQRAARLSALTSLLFALPILVAIIFGGTFILGVFGSEFPVGYAALLILSGGQFVNVLCGLNGAILMMTGSERVVSTGFAVLAAANVLLNAVLIPRFGLIGAAAATAVSISMLNIVLLSLVLTRLDVNPTAFILNPGRR